MRTPRAAYPYDPANRGRVFHINPTDMSDGSGRLYSIDTQEGERIASCTDEFAARKLRNALNDALSAWAAQYAPDAVIAC
jgi:hypothetical protein